MLHKHAMGMQAALAVAKLFGYIGFAVFDDLTLTNAILVDTVAHGISYAGLYWAYRRYCLPPASAEPFKLEPDERKRLLKYGFFYNFNDAGTLALNSRLENFFVAAIMGPLAVGAYAFYSRLYIMTNRLLPVSMFQNVVQPVMFAVPKPHAAARLPGYFSFLVDTNVLLQLPITAFAVAYHKEIVEVIFGSRFIEDSLLMPLVFLFAAINVIATPVTIVAQYEEKAAVVLLSRVFGAYNIGALLLLIPILGVYGAAIATGSAEAMKNFFIWWHVRHTARWINWKSALLSGVLLWSAFVLVCVQIRAYFALPSIVHLVIGAAISIVVFAVYLRTPALSANDRTLLASLVKNRGERLLRLTGVLPARG
jgi:O-antigen/teichoic acid export membrane protein